MRMGIRPIWTMGALIAALLVPAGAQAAPKAVAQAPATPGTPAADLPQTRIRVAEADRQAVLGPQWSSSKDLAWTTEGDSTGFHLLVAEASTGYAWRTVASLAEPGYDTDRWVGNACLTGSAKRAVVVYAPRRFSNSEQLAARGAYAAVVDLAGGRVTRLPIQVALAYHNPGCGTGETAVLNQSGGTTFGATRLHVVDTAKGTVTRRVQVAGQVTSAIPVAGQIVAAYRNGVSEISSAGVARTLTTTVGTPAYLRADPQGGVAFLEAQRETAVIKHYQAGRTRELARGPLTEIGLAAGAGGRAFITGNPTTVGSLPPSVTRISSSARAEVSTLGQLAVSHEAGPTELTTLSARATATGRSAQFSFPLAATVTLATVASLGSPTDPVEAEATCSVPRNDERFMVLQPGWKQVEWAADLAVNGALTMVRPADWNRSGLQPWQPQLSQPPIPLAGGGQVPPQILLGILAQESNLWQASGHALEGEFGNPLIGDYYGRRGQPDEWNIRWDKADCGYGVAQVTDNMRKGDQSEVKQRQIAVDYATNIAAGLRILQGKWNQLYGAVTINNGRPDKIENWFAALWAYNTGVNPGALTGNTSGCTPSPTCTDTRGNWGLGWTNNPMNPTYPPNRTAFLSLTQDDARHPQDWPYQEKVIGWAAFPIIKTDYRKPNFYTAAYNQAWWGQIDWRAQAKPPINLFCGSAPGYNHCDPQLAMPCLESDLHCWWNRPAIWKLNDCAQCGNPSTRFPNDYPEPQFALTAADEPTAKMPTAHYKPNCTPFSTADGARNALPSGALIVDDARSPVSAPRPGCSNTWTNSGSFQLRFAADGAGMYRSKIDLHQLGGGMAGHFWFAHSHLPDSPMEITGTWTLGQPLNQWARVMVHMPDHGAQSQQARYKVDLGNGTVKERVLLQRTEAHEWVSLGVFPFSGVPKVSLSNITLDGDGSQDIAWDAIAFQRLPGKPADIIVAMGDSFASGEGVVSDTATGADYYRDSDNHGGGVLGTYRDSGYNWKYGNACHRSKKAWSRVAKTPSNTSESIGSRMDRWDPTVDFQLLACSGAVAMDMAVGYVGKFREVSQIDRGFLDENTTTVMFSIGGNDASFIPVVKHCLKPTSYPCQTTVLSGETDILANTLPAAIRDRGVRGAENRLLESAVFASNAKIVVVGYPVLVTPGATCLGGTFHFPVFGQLTWEQVDVGLTVPEVNWLAEQADYFDEQLRAMVTRVAAERGRNFTFADPRSEFAGHGMCDASPYFNKLVITRTAGETPRPPTQPDNYVSQQSVHPNVAGGAAYGRVITEVLSHP